MDHGFKELVDRILNGELGFEMTKNADRYFLFLSRVPPEVYLHNKLSSASRASRIL